MSLSQRHPRFQWLTNNKSLTKNTLMFLIFSSLGNIFAYFYLVFVGRNLGPQSFGFFGSLYGIFNIFCLLGHAIRISIANNLASLRVHIDEAAAIRSLLSPFIKIISVGTFIFIIIAISAKPIAGFFQMDTVIPVFILSISLISVLFTFIVLGVFQGLQHYHMSAITGYLIPQSFKLIFVVIFTYIGWGLSGAIGALLTSNVLAILIGGIQLFKIVAPSFQTQTSPTSMADLGLPPPAIRSTQYGSHAV